ncbi:hypothetical protein ACLOJK_028195 [Asimina triloba]
MGGLDFANLRRRRETRGSYVIQPIANVRVDEAPHFSSSLARSIVRTWQARLFSLGIQRSIDKTKVLRSREDRADRSDRARRGEKSEKPVEMDACVAFFFSLRGRVVAPPSGPQSLSRRKQQSQQQQQPITGRARIIYRESQPPDFPFWQHTWFLLLLLFMAFSLFAVAIFLFLELDHSSPFPAAAAPEGVEITYGTVLKLMHERTKIRLHSHDVPYGSGSGQQSVTGFPNVDDSNSYWIVKSSPDLSAKQGDPIKPGTIIRLQHMRTRKWLHSHLHASPISGNLEVNLFHLMYYNYFCGTVKTSYALTKDFGLNGVQHLTTITKLHIEGTGKTWKQNQKIRLQHVDTGGYLHSHDKKYTRIAGGQQEVCGVRDKRPDNIWLAAEGVYLPITGSQIQAVKVVCYTAPDHSLLAENLVLQVRDAGFHVTSSFGNPCQLYPCCLPCLLAFYSGSEASNTPNWL